MKWKVFGTREFHRAVTKGVGMEGICHKGVSHLQMCFTSTTKRQWKMFVVWEIHICYKERSMQGACYNSVTQVLLREELKVYVIRDFPFSYIETMVGETSWCLF